MGAVYGNVKVNYGYCKSVAQLKSADDYILGRRKEQIADGVVKTQNHLYNALGCNRDTYYVKDKSHERCNFAEYQMKKREKLSFREEIKIYLRNAINTPETRTLEDVIQYVKDYFMMDVKLRGNTISYALPYRRKKNGEPVSVRGKRLGDRFTVSGITECLEQKEKKRIEYQRIEADIEHMKEFLRDYDEWEKEPGETTRRNKPRR